MNAVVGQIRRQVTSIKDKILRDLVKTQKKELDAKVDEMLKGPKVNRVMVKYLGVGRSFGKKMGSVASKGLSLLKKLL